MLDFLFAVGQFLCVLGLVYGLILTIAHRDCVDSLRAHYDPIAGHDWLSISIEQRPGVSAAHSSSANDAARSAQHAAVV